MCIRTVLDYKTSLFLALILFGMIKGLKAQEACYQPSSAILQIYDVNCYGSPLGTEWIVLEVVGNGNIDIEGYIVDDNNFPSIGVGNAAGHVRFPAGRYNSVPAGTKIYLYYVELPAYYVDDDLNWKINIDEMVIHSSCPNSEYSGCDCPEGGNDTWLGRLALSDDGDICQIRTPQGERIDYWPS